MKRVLYWMDVAGFLALAAALARYGDRGARFFAGMGVAATAFGLWMLARRQLGESFSVRAKAKRLVTTGLYSKIRNPIYVFGMLAYAGLAVAWGRWNGFVWVALAAAFEYRRARQEQAVLEQAFGEEYRAYQARTWF